MARYLDAEAQGGLDIGVNNTHRVSYGLALDRPQIRKCFVEICSMLFQVRPKSQLNGLHSHHNAFLVQTRSFNDLSRLFPKTVTKLAEINQPMDVFPKSVATKGPTQKENGACFRVLP